MTSQPFSDRTLLMHILECIERINECTENSRGRSLTRRSYRMLSFTTLQVLAESAQRLNSLIKASRTDIPWSEVSGFRNVIHMGTLGSPRCRMGCD